MTRKNSLNCLWNMYIWSLAQWVATLKRLNPRKTLKVLVVRWIKHGKRKVDIKLNDIKIHLLTLSRCISPFVVRVFAAHCSSKASDQFGPFLKFPWQVRLFCVVISLEGDVYEQLFMIVFEAKVFEYWYSPLNNISPKVPLKQQSTSEENRVKHNDAKIFVVWKFVLFIQVEMISKITDYLAKCFKPNWEDRQYLLYMVREVHLVTELHRKLWSFNMIKIYVVWRIKMFVSSWSAFLLICFSTTKCLS